MSGKSPACEAGTRQRAGELRRTLAGARIERLANGLVVATLPQRQAPLVTTALIFRAGTRGAAVAGRALPRAHDVQGLARLRPG